MSEPPIDIKDHNLYRKLVGLAQSARPTVVQATFTQEENAINFVNFTVNGGAPTPISLHQFNELSPKAILQLIGATKE
tara:strand:+ start:10834 stop:11067 length:234 start_codon:yes stop_codon:yes gene_type:complete